MRLLLISLISIFLSTSVWAGEWQNKPIHCMDKDEILQKIQAPDVYYQLHWNALQTTWVKTQNGEIAEQPVFIPVTMYTNKDTGNFIIVEYHKAFAKYCILSQGSGLVVKAE